MEGGKEGCPMCSVQCTVTSGERRADLPNHLSVMICKVEFLRIESWERNRAKLQLLKRTCISIF